MFNYGDIIEYVDGTYDENFNNARKWANSNRATFNELIDRRKEIDGVLHRFYEIKEIIVPEPTAEEQKQARINELQQYLSKTDWYAIRESETGVDIPAEVKKTRADARAEISSLRGDEVVISEMEKVDIVD